MQITSAPFAIFIAAALILHYALPSRFRWVILLAASLYFYACWNVIYVPLLLSATALDYVFAKAISSTPFQSRKKRWLILSLSLNLFILFLFKYFSFSASSLNALFEGFNIALRIPFFHLLMPLGISFFTFKKMSYVIDVFKRKIGPEAHFGRFAVYVTFFPAIAAGPIDRAGIFLPQIQRGRPFEEGDFTAGCKLLLWGFFKKFVIAERIAALVTPVFSQPQEHTGLTLLMAVYLYSFQIFCDFSGYTDIALGIGRLFGLRLTQNFNLPYFANSIADFWRRWHITFTTWMRDYVFLPLSFSLSRKFKKNKVLLIRTDHLIYILAISFTWFLVGLWHGAGWTFIAWGLLHAAYLVVSVLTRKSRKRAWKKLVRNKTWRKKFQWISVFITFHLVTFAWIFFRANSLSDAILIIKNILLNIRLNTADIQLDHSQVFVVLGGILFLLAAQFIHSRINLHTILERQPVYVRWALYYVFIFAIFFFGRFETMEFIYFQF